MEPSNITIPIDQVVTFKRADLMELKNSQNGYKSSQFFRACSISNAQYCLKIYPNGSNEVFRGKVCMFFIVKQANAICVDSKITVFVESANYQRVLQEGRGVVLCPTSNFFDLNDYKYFGSWFFSSNVPSSKFFVDGKLTVRISGTLKIVLPSSKFTYPFAIQWNIKQADLEALKTSTTNARLATKEFKISSDSDVKYYLQIFPNGNKEENRGKAWIFLQLILGSASEIETLCNFSIISANFEYDMQAVYEESKGWGTSICSTDDLFNPDNRYIVDGELVIKVTGTLFIEKEKRNSSTLACEDKISNKANQKRRGRNFTIVVGEKKIKVHKKVLNESSPVFEAMFRSGMKEVTEKKMDIPDFSSDIVEAAVKLLYSDSIPSTFTFEQMLSLLQFADKYDIKVILDLVQDFLIEKLSPSNVCYLINFTTTNTVSATKLHSKCVKYLLKCSKESQAVHNLHILDKEFVVKMFCETFTQTE